MRWPSLMIIVKREGFMNQTLAATKDDERYLTISTCKFQAYMARQLARLNMQIVLQSVWS